MALGQMSRSYLSCHWAALLFPPHPASLFFLSASVCLGGGGANFSAAHVGMDALSFMHKLGAGSPAPNLGQFVQLQ